MSLFIASGLIRKNMTEPASLLNFTTKKVQDVQIIYNERGSKGFGFVTIIGIESAERVKNALHGSIVQGHYLVLSFFFIFD